MKNKLLTFTAIAAVSLGSSLSAGILPYDDYLDLDVYDTSIASTTQNFQGGITGSLDITGNTPDASEYYGDKYDKLGFDSSLDIVTNVALAFSFYQWVGNSRVWAQIDVDLNLGDAGLVSRSPSSPSPTGGVVADPLEFNFLLDTGPISGSTSLSSEVAVKLITDVQADGIINWGIDVGSATGVHLFAAALGVESHRAPVSDSGSTMALLGAGLFGLTMLRRRVR